MKNKYLIFTLLWTAFIAVLSFTPGNYIPKVDWEFLAPDTIAHILFYAVLVFPIAKLLMLNGAKLYQAMLYSFTLSFMYGFMIEYVQGNYISGRYFDMYDVLSNSLGGVMGLITLKIKNMYE